MSRQKKLKSLQLEKKEELPMTDTMTLEETVAPDQTLDLLESELDRVRQELEQAKIELEEKRAEAQIVARREIDPKEQAIIEKQVSGFSRNAGLKDKIERQKARDNELVTGKFINRHRPGQPTKIPYLKYADDPVKWWPFADGQTYTIPRGLADQLNGGTDEDPCYYVPKFIQKQGIQDPSAVIGENSAIHSVDASNKKFAFVPVNF